MARSSTEAEYRAMSFIAAELAWLQQLLLELHIKSTEPPLLLCDNLSAIFLSSNPVVHRRSKHFEIDQHYVRERVERNQLRVRYVPTEEQIADIFTKPCSSSRFKSLRFKLNVRSLPLILRGDVSR